MICSFRVLVIGRVHLSSHMITRPISFIRLDWCREDLLDCKYVRRHRCGRSWRSSRDVISAKHLSKSSVHFSRRSWWMWHQQRTWFLEREQKVRITWQQRVWTRRQGQFWHCHEIPKWTETTTTTQRPGSRSLVRQFPKYDDLDSSLDCKGCVSAYQFLPIDY